MKKNKHQIERTGGFTLVELVVVIAIMGILAGGASVGYSGYVKNAQKKADQTLVGNIIRAIETGTNSTMFVPPASIDIGATTYPIGFIVLNNTNGQVLTSNSELVSNVQGKCNFVTLNNATIVTLEETNKTYECPQFWCSVTQTVDKVYTLSNTNTVRYCTEHSKNITVIEDAQPTTYTTGYSFSCNKGMFSGKHNAADSKPVTQSVSGNIIELETNGVLYKEQASGMCELAYANQTGSFVRPDPAEGEKVQYTRVNGDHVLNQAIEAAFGSSANLALQYDGWAEENDSNINYATLYSYMPTLMTDVNTLGGNVAKISSVLGSDLSQQFLGGEFASADEVLSSLADITMTAYPGEAGKEEWIAAWMNAGDSVWSSEGFGLDLRGGGRTHYCAARKGYNSAFASYLSENGIGEDYYEIISDFTTPISDNPIVSGALALARLDGNLPALVNSKTFEDESSGLKDKFVAKGDEDGKIYEQCQKLFNIYKTSDACRQNGATFYDTMNTIHQTDEEASNPNNTAGGYFEYYDNYLNEISGLYTEAQKAAKGGILILVTSENGVVRCDVSPSSADLRNKD